MKSKSLPKELVQARELMDQAKLDEALEIIEKFENGKSFSPEDQLSVLLIKAEAYLYKQRTRKALQAYEVAYQMSQDLGLLSESVSALIGKAYIGFFGDRDKANSYVSDAEERLKTLADDPSTENLRRNLLYIKSWILYLKGNGKDAAEIARECLILTKEKNYGNKLDLAATYLLLGHINFSLGNRTKALDYTMKSLECNKELNLGVAIADCHSLIATMHLFKGDYDEALQYCKQSISIEEISGRTRLNVLRDLAVIYYYKSELNKVLKYRQQAVNLAEELNIVDQLILALNDLGFCYRVIGNIDLAKETFEHSLTLSEKLGYYFEMARSLMGIIWLYIGEGSREEANRYFSRLSELYEQTKGKVDIYNEFLFSKANLMKTSPRMRDHVEAQALFKQLIENNFPRRASRENLVFDMGHLCDLLLEELSLYNNPVILDEITPLITKMLEMAEDMRNYHWLAEAKLLQAKLALIQTDIEEARRLMVEAQRIAEIHGLNLLASKISSEHDKLLTQVDIWDNLKNSNAPMRDRIKLASTEGVLERLQGERAVEPSESVDDQSILLMIIAEGGVLIFSYPFSEEWKFDDELFGGFLTAFNSISDEIFSEGLDRVKFGNQTVLIEQVANFSICYLFKGLTYVAQQKLTKFVEEMQKDTSLWQNLENHYKTSQILELKESPQLESLIAEIFTGKS